MSAKKDAHWSEHAFFYHIYPLGMFGAPQCNDFCSAPESRINLLYNWIHHLKDLGVNALYIGPLFESSSHGYDTVDYFHLDRRLGSNQDLKTLVQSLHRDGIRVVLDAVFNHVGRDFFAFKDLQRFGKRSKYVDWFENLNFEKRSPAGDPFSYAGWKGHYDLVKLNLTSPDVKAYLFKAVKTWIKEFEIDGLRLDAADCMDLDFLKDLATFSKKLKPDFWLMGEIVFGDYSQWANPETLHSVTNYECYDSLHKSHNEENYEIIAQALERQFGPQGVYKDLKLYAFADNHDVNRISSLLQRSELLYPLHVLLMTMPGVPSLYYGSEWGIEGKRKRYSDRPLRPYLPHPQAARSKHRDLYHTLKRLSAIYHGSDALRIGKYQLLFVDKQRLAFLRQSPTETMIILLNNSKQALELKLDLPDELNNLSYFEDLLNPGEVFEAKTQSLEVKNIYPNWARILKAYRHKPLTLPRQLCAA